MMNWSDSIGCLSDFLRNKKFAEETTPGVKKAPQAMYGVEGPPLYMWLALFLNAGNLRQTGETDFQIRIGGDIVCHRVVVKCRVGGHIKVAGSR